MGDLVLIEGKSDLIAGAKVILGGKEWIVPPLTIAQVQERWADIEKISGANDVLWKFTPEKVTAFLDVVLAAMSRNYPDLTRDNLAEMLDLGNALIVLRAVLGAPV
jgi:hypothetical protein